MPYSNLKRDKEAVLKSILTTPKGDIIAKTNLKVVFPVNYETSHLANIEKDTYALGIFIIVVGNNYATNIVPAKVRFDTSDVEKVKYGEEYFYELTFEKGATIVENTNLVKDETLGYYIYNYFVALGRIPWFLNAYDIITLFDETGKYTGKTYGDNHVIMEMIMSMIMRNNNDIHTYWRQGITKESDLYLNRPETIPLRNVDLGARNTTAKLMGAYFNEGLNSALLNPAEHTEQVEELLRQ